MLIASLALAVLASARPTTDTTLALRPGTRVVIESHAGQIQVDTWKRNEIHIVAEHKRRARLVIEPGGNRLDISAEGSMGEPVWVDYQITVPADTPLELSGIDVDIEVSGTRGEVKAESVQGDIVVNGGEGSVSANSVEGTVEVIGPRGRVEVASVNNTVRVVGARGAVQASAISGNVYLEDLESEVVEASTINGEVYFLGAFKENGTYSFSTHDGDLVVAVPDKASVSGSVATFQGDFESTFPVETTEKRRGKQVHFTLGDGSARLEIDAFNGDVRLDRPEAVAKLIAGARAEATASAAARSAQAKSKSAMKKAEKDLERQVERQQEKLEKQLEKQQQEIERQIERQQEKLERQQDNQDDDDDGEGR
jgi:molecular chaperone DnaK (HSP70)